MATWPCDLARPGNRSGDLSSARDLSYRWTGRNRPGGGGGGRVTISTDRPWGVQQNSLTRLRPKAEVRHRAVAVSAAQSRCAKLRARIDHLRLCYKVLSSGQVGSSERRAFALSMGF